MDNIGIARVLGEIGDLLEIKNENPFKIRAYRNAAEAIARKDDRAVFEFKRLAVVVEFDGAAAVDGCGVDVSGCFGSSVVPSFVCEGRGRGIFGRADLAEGDGEVLFPLALHAGQTDTVLRALGAGE